jgi:CMP-N-acetylneuraminic acid synthetase
MSTIACIFARAGSKGIPNKNIQLFNGRPLIIWSIEMALAINLIDQVYVSTDSEEIASIARSAGAIVPFIRPKELASDVSPEWLSWQHFLISFQNSNGELPEIFLSLPTTSPLRSRNDIEKCVNEFKKGKADIVLGVTKSNRSPYFNMVTKDGENALNLVINEGGQFVRRQDTPEIFDLTTACYVGKPTFILEKGSIFEGRVVGVEIPSERAIDIDTPLDFQIAEFLHKSMELS